MHKDAPTHFLPAFREFLNMSPEQSTGRGGPTVRPAPSSDLNPLGFCPWGVRSLTLCCKSKRSAGLATTSRMEFSCKPDSHCSEVQHAAVKLEGTRRAFSFSVRRHNSEIRLHKAYFHIFFCIVVSIHVL